MDTFPKEIFDRRGSIRRLAAVLGVFLSCVSASAGAGPEMPIRFAEELFPGLGALMERAAMEATELQLGELRLEERSGELDVAIAQRRPNVRLFGRAYGTYETRSDIPDEFRGDLNANLTISQPLYQWGALKRRQEIAENRLEVEAVELERTGQRAFMELRRAYLQWLLMRERRKVLTQSIALSQDFVSARRQLVEAGQSSEQDVLEMEARLLENRESLAWVEKNIVALRNQLEQFTGDSARLEDLTSRSLDVIEPIGGTALLDLRRKVLGEAAELSDPLLERWALLESIEEQQLNILDKRNWPTFDLIAGVFSDRLDAINQADSVLRVRYFMGLQVNWNLFDSWQTDGYKRSALARKRAFALRKEAVGEDLDRRAEVLLADLELNLKQIEAREKRENLLERRVSLLRQQAERNLVTGTERIEGEIDYLEVRQRLMEARVNYLMNLMELGILLDMDPAARYYTEES